MEHQIIFGTSALNNRIPPSGHSFFHYPGQSYLGEEGFGVDNDILSRHVLLLGGSGCGKTNVFMFTIQALREKMTLQDVMIVFDTKGEFYDHFAIPGDYVIGNSSRFRPISHTWNIFDDLLADGESDDSVSMNARELANALFHGRGSTTQPFFCNAARDIFRCILLHFVRQSKEDPTTWRPLLNNRNLIAAFREFTIPSYIQIFEHYPDMRNLVSYFGNGSSDQALGVFGELNSMLTEYFTGIMEEYRPERSISMRQAVRQRGNKAIFIEYDLAVGETLTPVYRLLMDQALKEALGRSSEKGTKDTGRLFVFADEFKLLPKLQHIDDALNFGRGLGVRVMAGIQSIEQLYDSYGPNKGAVIAGGFGSLFAFHTNDDSSREYIQKRFGRNVQVYEYANQFNNKVLWKERDGYTVEPWEQLNLGVGQAFIGLGDAPPFLFQFEEFGKEVL